MLCLHTKRKIVFTHREGKEAGKKKLTLVVRPEQRYALVFLFPPKTATTRFFCVFLDTPYKNVRPQFYMSQDMN